MKEYVGEIFKEFPLEGNRTLRYAISNYGRLVSFKHSIEEGKVLRGGTINGYRIFRYSYKNSSDVRCYGQHLFYHLVAEYFLEKAKNDEKYLLHSDYNKQNDYVGNLKWATKEEFTSHFMNSPSFAEGVEKSAETRRRMDGVKLTSTQVMHIKKILADPNRKTRLKMIAKRFGISPMQLYRIKSGENWGHVKI